MSKPTIRILRSGDEAILEDFLLPRVESSMFLIGNLRASGLVDSGQTRAATYAAAFEGEKIVGVVAHNWSQTLLLQAPVHLDSLWRVALEVSQRPISGLMGPNEQVIVVKEALELDDSRIQLDEAENLYSLELDDLIIPDELSSGKVDGRRIEPRDLELITKWRVAYSIETVGAKDGPELWEQCRASVERYLEEGRIWVLEYRGEPVACSSFNAVIKEAVQVGGVWTPPELRRRGYGRSIVAASLLNARSKGVGQAILFTGESNIAAQKAYAALGFQHIGDYRLVFLKSPLEVV